MASNHSLRVYISVGILLALTWITSILRIYAKAFKKSQSESFEDWLALVALLLFTCLCVFALEGMAHGMGLRAAEVPFEDFVPAIQYWFGIGITYALTTCFTKLSITIFLLRIVIKPSHKYILYGISGIVVCSTIAFVLFFIFQCSPVDDLWNSVKNGRQGNCLLAHTIVGLTYAFSGVSAVADLVLSVLPIIIVSQLQMNPRTKITVCIILGLGLLACIAVIVRIPYLEILVNNPHELLYTSVNVVTWSIIEPGLGLTAANMATLRSLFADFFSRTKLWGKSVYGKKPPIIHKLNRHPFSGISNPFSRVPNRFSRTSSQRTDTPFNSRSHTQDVKLQDMDLSGITITPAFRDYGETENWDVVLGSNRADGLIVQNNASGPWQLDAREVIPLDFIGAGWDDQAHGGSMASRSPLARVQARRDHGAGIGVAL